MKTITRIHIEGFRSLQDVTFEPGPLTVLIGPNGAGKSNVLSFLRMLTLMGTRSLRLFCATQGGASTLLHRGPPDAEEIGWRVETSDEHGRIAFGGRLAQAAGDQLVFSDEYVEGSQEMDIGRAWGSSLGLGTSSLDIGRRERRPGIADQALRTLRRMSYFHFHDTSPSSKLRSNARGVDHQYLRSDGSNLAAYLLARKLGEREDSRAAWRMLEGLVRQVAPFIKSLEPTPNVDEPEAFRWNDPELRLDQVTVRLDWIDENDNRFGVGQLSDGTLRAIALFAALTQPGATLPTFITIDEPELGLHPAALALFVELVRSISHRAKVVLATQSPALLNLVEPEEVRVVERVNGATQLRRLDRESLAEWLEEYSLAELYDKNLLGGRP
ncbi:MAG: AAA family ATPase [Deltaproteobacteria bacterium]|nr:AAA family ATPase [Deltaproteobacteria bacterium]